MADIILLLATFSAAVLGIYKSNRSEESRRTFIGMNMTGAILLLLSAVGFVASGIKLVNGTQKAQNAQARSEADAELFKKMDAKLSFLIGESDSPALTDQLEALRNEMSLRASQSRRSDFSLSDFSQSSFHRGNFTLTLFSNSLFRDAQFQTADFQNAEFNGSDFHNASFKDVNLEGADFRGVDFSGALIDESFNLQSTK